MSHLRRLLRRVPRRILHLFLYVAFLSSLLYFYFAVVTPGVQNGSHRRQGLHQPGRERFAERRVYTADDYGRDGEDPFTEYRSLSRVDWLDRDTYEREQRREGVGEQGRPITLPKDNETLNALRDEIYRVNGYDGYVSDLVALNRSVKDIRNKECMSEKYLERLPSVSVIFPFHDEHLSALLRSVYSILNRSPPEVLREIILVDDASTKPALKEPLEEHLRQQGLDDRVHVVRTTKREGLIRARIVGAKAASAEVLVFLDAHSEANYNWLPPLVEPIALDYRTVVCPFVDVIDCDTFEYRAQDEGARGSFDWEFNYKRLPVTAEDRKQPTKPFKSPVMAGGYFAISTKWFWELGGYDDELQIWGGEQYELSFKIWQCHGQLVDAPCSRVGHIYRCKYVPFPNPGVGDFISRNYKRVAEVWMDEYKDHLYKRRTSLLKADPGDLNRQKAVRERLQCKSFDWFMKEVAFDQDHYYPAVEPPDGASGELRNVAAGKCVDTRFKGSGQQPLLRTCLSENAAEGGEQNMRLSFWEDIRPMGRTMCLDVSTSVHKAPVTLFACHGMKGNQFFVYRPRKKQIYHKVSNLCMDCDVERGDIFMSPCDADSASQQWQWTHVNETVIEERARKDQKAEKNL